MNPSSQMLIISLFLTFSLYIFSEFISLKYHYTFSLYQVTDFTIREFLHLLNETFYNYLSLELPNTICYYHSYRSSILPSTNCYYHIYWLHWLSRHHLLIPQLSITWLTNYHMLLVTNPLGFPYQIIKYLDYGEWIRLFELKYQSIIQHISLNPEHLEF